MISRANKTPLSQWWYSIDRPLLVILCLLPFLGLIFSFSASPGVALRLGLDPFHFVIRHAIFITPSLIVLLLASFIAPRHLPVLAGIMLLGGMVLMLITQSFGLEANGSRRWLHFGPFSLQPTEFVKPALIVCLAWLLAQKLDGSELRSYLLCALLLMLVVSMLVMQPDNAQAALILMSFAGLFFVSGAPMGFILILMPLGALGAVGAYFSFDYVASRIDRFFDPDAGLPYQVERAYRALLEGGWWGRGPGEGVQNLRIPDAHADYVVSAIVAEFGIVTAFGLAFLFVVLILRVLLRAMKMRDSFARLAAVGLSIQIGLQALINFAVNLNLMPPTGMTLPFISYGGTSMVATAVGLGLVLGLTRRTELDRCRRRPVSAQRQAAIIPAAI